MKNEQLMKLIETRLSFLANDFPRLSGSQCSELLKFEITCLRKLIQKPTDGRTGRILTP